MMSVVECVWSVLNVSCGMCVVLDCYYPKCLVAITSFPGNILYM